MKKSWKILSCIGLAAILGGCAATKSDDEKASMLKAPPAVQATAKQILGDKESEGIDQETEGGKTVYELGYKVSGTDYAAVINEAGDVIEREVDVDLSAVPPNIIEAVQKTHPEGKIKEASIVNAENKLFYEFDLKVGSDTHEIKVSAKGKVQGDMVGGVETMKKEKPAEKETPAAK